MAVLYLDEVIILNLLADYVILLAAAKLSGRAASRRRLLAGAAVGAGYGLAAAVFPALSGSICKVLAGAAMTALAFGRKRILRLGLLVFGTAAAFSGAVTALASGGRITVTVAAAAFLLCLTVYPAVFRGIAAHRIKGEIVPITASLGGRRVTFPALVDTGNSLRDPVTGKPVTVVSLMAAEALFDRETYEILNCPDWLEHIPRLDGKFTLIPFNAIGGGGLLPAVRPDSMAKGDTPCTGEFLAIARRGIDEGKGYAAITAAGKEEK